MAGDGLLYEVRGTAGHLPSQDGQRAGTRGVPRQKPSFETQRQAKERWHLARSKAGQPWPWSCPGWGYHKLCSSRVWAGAAAFLACSRVPQAPFVPTGGERTHGAAGLGGDHEEAAMHPAGGLRECPGCLHQPLRRVSPDPVGAPAAGTAPASTRGCAGTEARGMREAKGCTWLQPRGGVLGCPAQGCPPGSPPPHRLMQHSPSWSL